MNIAKRKNLMRRIMADLQLLIEDSWQMELVENLGKALMILEKNEELEGYDD